MAAKPTPPSDQSEDEKRHSGEKERLMEQAQEDAAHDRESNGGYQ